MSKLKLLDAAKAVIAAWDECQTLLNEVILDGVSELRTAIAEEEAARTEPAKPCGDPECNGLTCVLAQRDKLRDELEITRKGLDRKTQGLRGSIARYHIELTLAENLLDDPDYETTAMEMEYWGPLHDKISDLQSIKKDMLDSVVSMIDLVEFWINSENRREMSRE